jgi:hypothetical protein
MSDGATLHQKIEGRRGGKTKGKGDYCVFGFCKSDNFFCCKNIFYTLEKTGFVKSLSNIIHKLAPERNSFTFIVLNGIFIMES